jgi:hypothetical protein
MKRYILFLISMFYLVSIHAQNVTWQTIDDTPSHVSVQLPAYYVTHVDTLDLIMYSTITQDSLVGGQLFIYNNYSLDSNDVIGDYMQLYNETDTLAVIAQFMVEESGGTLEYINFVENTDSSKVMDIGISYVESSTSFVTFSRLKVMNKKMAILNVFAQDIYMTELIAARDQCFGSLLFY